MRKLSIRMKILLPTVALVVLGFAALTVVIMMQFSMTSEDLQNKYSEEFAYHNIFIVKAMLEVPMDEARSLATAFGEAKKEKALTREQIVHILEEWLKSNDTYFGVYTGWEPNAFDGNDAQYADKQYHDSTGRFVPYVFKDGDTILKEALVDYDTEEYYQGPKTKKNEIITNPYEYVAGGKTVNLVSMVIPIMVDGEFMGIVGVDILMDDLQALTDDTKLFDTGYIGVLSSDATVVAHQNREIINTDVTQYFDASMESGIKNSITNGTVYATNNISVANGVESHVVFVSAEVGYTGCNWTVFTSVPRSELNASTSKAVSSGIILAFIFVVLILGILVVVVHIFIAKPITGSINQIQSSAGQVTYSAKQFAETSQQLSEGSTEQAASIEETSATMDETTSMVQQNAENTRQANALSEEASSAAQQGSRKMQEMTDSMEELKKSSGEISKIIKVIDDIAFQTNMLALNAAVEAARAGDVGQGFAVVAEEVRSLAQKSAQAAKDTAEIIDRNIDLSDRGVSISGEVNVALDEIMQKAKAVNQLIGEISAASEEQARGTTQVTEAISQMEVVVQSNAASAEESAASSEELKAQAAALQAIVIELNKMVKGEKAAQAQKNSIGETGAISLPKGKTSSKKIINQDNSQKKHIMAPDDVIPLDDDSEF